MTPVLEEAQACLPRPQRRPKRRFAHHDPIAKAHQEEAERRPQRDTSAPVKVPLVGTFLISIVLAIAALFMADLLFILILVISGGTPQ